MPSLKNNQKIKQVDKSNLRKTLKNFPDQITKAKDIFADFELPDNFKNIENILVCGMGGSAISGDIAYDIVKDSLLLPMFVNKDYFLPHWVSKNTLVIVVSHSGNTNETIQMAKQANKKKAKTVFISSNGKLEKISQNKNIPYLEFPFKKPSRTNIGYSLTFICLILKKLKLVSNLSITASVPKLKEINKMFYPDKSTDINVAKHLAYFIFDHLPIIVSTPELKGVANRFKTQISENSKTFSYTESLPEMIHNSIEAKHPWRLKDEIVFLVFENIKKHKNTEKTIQEFFNLLKDNKMRWQKIPDFAKDKVTQILGLVSLVDWTSFYLAILEENDPTPIEKITKAKKKIYES